MKPKILLVDDAPNIRLLLEYNLKKHFDITIHEDGEDARKWLEAGNKPDLIVTDIMMPNLDGYEFVKFVRGNKELRETPIIILSARGQSTDRIQGLKSGADDYITKPFNPEELIMRINKLLERHMQLH